MFHRRSCALLFVVTAFCTANADAAIVTINSNLVRSIVNDFDNPGASAFASYGGTAIPTTNHMVQALGASPDQFAKVLLNYSATLGVTSFNHQFNLSRQGGQFDVSQTYDSTLMFTVDSNTTYNGSGNMFVNDIGNSSGTVYYYSHLRDLTTNTMLFEFESISISTQDESFILGSGGGDSTNFLLGNLAGNLVAGHQYAWHTNAYIKAEPDPDTGATATGYFDLTIGAAAPVPEPSSILTLSGLAFAFGAGSWWRRRASLVA